MSDKPNLSKVITSWSDVAWQLRSYCVHDDDCTVNRYPYRNACSCGLSARLSLMDEMHKAPQAPALASGEGKPSG